MRRGINYKKVLVTLDAECLALLEEKKRYWDGFNQSAYIRKAVKAYEKKGQPAQSYEGVDVIYD